MATIFISHASEDKTELARPLALELQSRGHNVWLDEFSLKMGDSISQKIDEGLSKCDFGIVILSQNFINKKWTRKELSALTSKEANTDKKIILPVIHNLTIEQLQSFSPTLADKLGVFSDEGIKKIADQIDLAVGGNDKTQLNIIDIQTDKDRDYDDDFSKRFSKYKSLTKKEKKQFIFDVSDFSIFDPRGDLECYDIFYILGKDFSI